MTEKVEVRRSLTFSLAIGRADQGKKKHTHIHQRGRYRIKHQMSFQYCRVICSTPVSVSVCIFVHVIFWNRRSLLTKLLMLPFQSINQSINSSVTNTRLSLSCHHFNQSINPSINHFSTTHHNNHCINKPITKQSLNQSSINQ